MNPGIIVNLDKLTHNASEIVRLCHLSGVEVSAVTKGFCALPEAAAAIMEGGIKSLADSRIDNLCKLQDLKAEKTLLRIPMLSEVEMIIRHSDCSLHSQLVTLKALNRASGQKGTSHDVILMFDLGDLREGVFKESEFIRLAENTSLLKNIYIKGIGTNLTCFGAVIPERENLERLVSIAAKVSGAIGRKIELISGGNSSSIYLLQENKLPAGINHLRIGEAIICGTESAYFREIPNMYTDCFLLVAELVEVLEKPSLPIGTIGKDAFRQIPVFRDRGIRKRAIAAIGKQDTASQPLHPLDTGVEVLGGSSDHLLLDITDADTNYQVGDELKFSLGYAAILALTTSPYVSKNFVRGIS